jgi:hypothetical protein
LLDPACDCRPEALPILDSEQLSGGNPFGNVSNSPLARAKEFQTTSRASATARPKASSDGVNRGSLSS